jgi:hypothetical protein
MASEVGGALATTLEQVPSLMVLAAGVVPETTPGVDCHKMASGVGAEQGTIRAEGGALTDSEGGGEPGTTRGIVACPTG